MNILKYSYEYFKEIVNFDIDEQTAGISNKKIAFLLT